jgi:hypothetical protein
MFDWYSRTIFAVAASSIDRSRGGLGDLPLAA